MIRLVRLRRLYPSIQEHRQVEVETRRMLEESLDRQYVGDVAPQPGVFRYAQRHIFSILFLAVYRAVGVSGDRRLLYGMLNHAIRGIVTATDNILDDEYKEILPLRFPEKATRFKSVMHILLFDRFIGELSRRAALRGLIPEGMCSDLQRRLFAALVPIGAEEASEEGGVTEILAPEEVLRQVHRFKGGSLLRLAFVVPRLVEQALVEPLRLADHGMYRIGVALQVIDDLTDFYLDLQTGRHNYLLSSIRFEGSPAEQRSLVHLLSGENIASPPVTSAYPDSVRRVMARAIGEALAGFQQLQYAGFWMDRPMAQELIHQLFRLRGVADLLSLLPDRLDDADTLEVDVPEYREFDRISA